VGWLRERYCVVRRDGAVDFLESLLPHVRSRVVEVAEVNPEGGRIARFDNDLYLGVFRWGSLGPWNNVIETDFCLFVGTDLRPVRPPVAVLNRIRVRKPGYGIWPLGGILGPSTLRRRLRRVQLELAANFASLVLYRQKPRIALEPGAPPLWLRARFTFHPNKGRDGYTLGAYDWEALGHRLIESLDDIHAVLSEGSVR